MAEFKLFIGDQWSDSGLIELTLKCPNCLSYAVYAQDKITGLGGVDCSCKSTGEKEIREAYKANNIITSFDLIKMRRAQTRKKNTK
jgi:hypothetical protein